MEWLTSSIKTTTQGLSGGLNNIYETGVSPTKSMLKGSSKNNSGSEISSNKNSSGKSKQSTEEDSSLNNIKITEEMIEYVGMLAAHHETFLNFPLEHLEDGGWQHEVEVVQQQLQEVIIRNQKAASHSNNINENKHEIPLSPSSSSIQSPKSITSNREVEFPPNFQAEKVPVKSQSESSSKEYIKNSETTTQITPSKSLENRNELTSSNPIPIPQKTSSPVSSPRTFQSVLESEKPPRKNSKNSEMIRIDSESKKSDPTTSNSVNSFRLNKRQEKHAVLMLNAVPELAKMRFKLCPKMMSEQRFWKIYFSLMKNKVGNSLDENSFTNVVPHELRNEKSYTATKEYINDDSVHVKRNETFWIEHLSTSEKKEIDKGLLKTYIKCGIPDSVRRKAWMFLTGADVLLQQKPNIYLEALSRVFDGVVSIDECKITYSQLIGLIPNVFSFEHHHLNEKGVESSNRLIWVLLKSVDEAFVVHYIPDLVTLLLHFMSEEEAYVCSIRILENKKFSQFFYFDVQAFTTVVMNLIQLYIPDLNTRVNQLDVDRKFSENSFVRLFVSELPFQTVLRIFDVFLYQGVKFLFSATVAILQRLSPQLIKSNRFNSDLLDLMSQCHESDDLLQLAFDLPIKTKTLVLNLKEIRNSTLPPIDKLSVVLNQDQLAILLTFVPQRLRDKQPKLLYCSSKNGFNLNILMTKVRKSSPLFLVVKTKNQNIFGAFITVPLDKSSTYTGTGEMFLWRMTPTPKKYAWTGHNQYFMMLDSKPNISFGGGSGCGLWLDDELDNGSSVYNETFGNPALSGETQFRCVEIEVFGFE